MAINVACRCGKQMRVGDELAGRRAVCPSCGHGVRIPRVAGSPRTSAIPEPQSPALDQSSQRAGTSWLKVCLLGLLLLFLAGGTGFAIVYFNQERALLDVPTPPMAAAPKPTVSSEPPVVAAPPVAKKTEPEAPAAPMSEPTPPAAKSTPAPQVEVQRVEPAEPQAGKSLDVQLKGNRDGLKYEYRTEPDAEWQGAPEGKIAIKEVKPGPLTIEARAIDEEKRISEVVSRTWLVKSDAPGSFVGISGEPKADMPEKGRVQGAEPPKDPMKPLVEGGPMKSANKPGVQGGDPRRDPQLLVWKLKPADKLFQELHVAQKSAYRIQGIDFSTTLGYSILSSFVVDKKNDDGSLLVTQKVEATRLVQADSVTESLLTGALQKMQGAVYKLAFNPQMEITSFEGQQNPLRVIGGDPFGGGGGAFAMASLLDKDGWKEIDQLTFFQPGRPLKLNDRWQKPMTHNWGAFGQWQGLVAYTYGGKQGQFHRVGYTMNLAHAPAKSGSSGLPFQVSNSSFKHQEAGGMIYFDLEKGRVIGAEERFHVKGVLGIAAGTLSAPVEMDEEQAFRVLVHEKNPWQK